MAQGICGSHRKTSSLYFINSLHYALREFTTPQRLQFHRVTPPLLAPNAPKCIWNISHLIWNFFLFSFSFGRKKCYSSFIWEIIKAFGLQRLCARLDCTSSMVNYLYTKSILEPIIRTILFCCWILIEELTNLTK